MRRPVTNAALVALVALGACSSGETPGGQESDAALEHPDAAPQPAVGDSLPLGAISFFATTTCPTGWTPFTSGEGRFIVPVVGTSAPGTIHGQPLASGEERSHGHTVAATVEIDDTSYVGVAGGGNGGVAHAGTVSFATTTEAAPLGLPYVQLLVCYKSAAPVAARTPVPTGTLMFFRSNCPSGWTQATAAQGRWLVGLPEGAMAGVAFGGAALASDEERQNAHAANGTVTTSSHGIALAGGCCAGGYAKNGSYPYAATSGTATADLPYVELQQCRKD